MIAVYADRRGAKYRLLVQGHAGEGESAPLVCAAVSALTGALVSYAEVAPRCHKKRISQRAGEVFLSCIGGLRGAFDMTMQALEALAATYPENFYCLSRTVLADGTVKWENGAGKRGNPVAPSTEREG